MIDIATLLGQVVIGLVPLGVAVFSYRAATRASAQQARLERTKVDAEAFQRAREIYDDGIAQLERRIARLKAENVEALEERDAMLARVRALTAQMEEMERVVAALRQRLAEAGLPARDRDVGLPPHLSS